MNEESGEILTSDELNSSGEIVESGNQFEAEETTMTELEKDLENMDGSQNKGNLNIMIFTIVVCVIFGIILGIVAGKKSASK